jgi:malate synthase
LNFPAEPGDALWIEARRAGSTRGNERLMAYAQIGKISVATVLKDFIETEALPGTGVAPEQFWTGLAGLIEDFKPRIEEQLRFRDDLQGKLDAWHKIHSTKSFDMAAYEAFLREIGYLAP